MSDIPERVARGVALLDEHDPGWWREDAERPVNPADLSMGSCRWCVLGQRHGGSYDAGLIALGIEPGDLDEESAHGFNRGPVADEWRNLTDEWRRVIGERRAAS